MNFETKKTSISDKVMIIFWHWAYENLRWVQINDKMDKKIAYQWYHEKGSKYKKILIVKIENSIQISDVLQFFENKYVKFRQAEKQLFLHKNDFNATDVLAVKKKYGNNYSCFFFGEGRDYLYYGTNGEGLLGGDYKFYCNREGFVWEYKAEKKEKISYSICIANKDEKSIEPPRFDRVWRYYKHKFEQKFNELRIELLSHFILHLQTQTDVSFLDCLKEDEYLYLRYLSFMGWLEEEQKLKKYLMEYEQEDNRAYLFGNCSLHLSCQTSEKYQAICTFLEKYIEEGVIVTQENTPSFLNQLNQLFEELIATTRKLR